MKLTQSIGILALLTGAAGAAVDLEPLTYNPEIWKTSAQKTSKSFPELDWEETDKEHFVTTRDDLTFWGKSIVGAKLIQKNAITDSIEFTLIDNDSALKLSGSKFDQQAAGWKKLIDKKLGTAGKTMPGIERDNIKYTRVAWNFPQSVVVLSANKGDKPAGLTMTIYTKEKGYAYLRLKGWQPGDIVKTRPRLGDSTSKPLGGGWGASGEAAAKAKIKDTIKEIMGRDAPSGVSSKVQDAVNLLNVYRFLSSVPYDVEADKGMIKASEDAAAICRKNGTLSHDFGHSTDKCNLAMNSGNLTMANSVTQYINDSGENNRARRGHRRWCLNHKMGKTGFGITGAYSAMYSLDQSKRGIRKNYSYPGHGYYPIKYLHGNGWSYHLASGSAPAKVEVLVWKLRNKVEKAPSWSTEPEGKQLPVNYINTYSDTIIFEPQSEPITRKGCYLVRINGGGLKEQYVVNLF